MFFKNISTRTDNDTKVFEHMENLTYISKGF